MADLLRVLNLTRLNRRWLVKLYMYDRGRAIVLATVRARWNRVIIGRSEESQE
jgi:hypothetical protein